MDYHDEYHEFVVGQKVTVVEGFPGVVSAVEDGHAPGAEQYIVTLDGGMGGGEYGPGELTPRESRTSALAREAGEVSAERHEAEHHVASDDYPNLAEILVERPPLARVAARHEALFYPADDERGLDAIEAETLADLAGDIAAVVLASSDQHPGPGGVDRAQRAYEALVADPLLSATQRGSKAIFAWETYVGAPETPAMPVAARVAMALAVVDDMGVVVAGPFPDDDTARKVQADLEADGDRLDVVRIDNDPRYAALQRIAEDFGPVTTWINDRLPESMQIADDAEGNPRDASYDWCRFRYKQGCWYPRLLNKAETEAGGAPVWEPLDRGHCPHNAWDDQILCPVSQPGPNSGDEDAQDAIMP